MLVFAPGDVGSGRLRALDDTVRSTIHLSDMAGALARGEAGDRAMLADALSAAARLVATPLGAPEAPDRLRDADRAVREVLRGGGDAAGEGDPLTKAHAVAALGRIVDASRPLA